MSTSTVLRDACDACHGRKMRCPSEGVGACANCRRTGQVCKFSPRSEMGRPRLGSISSKRGHSHKAGKLSNAGTFTMAPPITSPSVETKKVTTLFQDCCRREAGYIEETDKTGHTDVNAYMETDPNQGVGTMDSETSTLVATTSSGGDIPLADSSNTMPSLYMLDDSWMTWTLPPTAPSIQVTDPTLPSVTRSSSSVPRSPSFLSSTAPGGSATNASATHSLLETYSQLSHILYALRNLPFFPPSEPEIPGHERQPPRQRALDQTFYLVSSLCDIIAWLASGPAMPTGGGELPCLLLVASVIASVMDIYRKTAQTYRELSRAHHQHGSYLFHPTHQPPKLGMLTPPSPPSLPPSGHLLPRDEGVCIGGTHQHTLMLSDVTVMGFHLARLQKALRDTRLAVCDDAQTLTQLEHERGFLQGLIEEWQGASNWPQWS